MTGLSELGLVAFWWTVASLVQSTSLAPIDLQSFFILLLLESPSRGM